MNELGRRKQTKTEGSRGLALLSIVEISLVNKTIL
jgi:hypothetical protein